MADIYWVLYVVVYGFDTSMWSGCNGPFDGIKQNASGETLLKSTEIRLCSRTFCRPIKIDPHTNPPRISYFTNFVLRNWPRFSSSVSRLCHFRSHSCDTNDHCRVPTDVRPGSWRRRIQNIAQPLVYLPESPTTLAPYWRALEFC